MAGTSGLSSSANGIAQLALAALNGGTALSVTAPLKVLFLTTVRTVNNGTDAEWSTGGSYVNGTGFSGLTFAAATTDTTGAHQLSNVAAQITNAPAGSWAGCIVKDSAGTPKEFWYAPVSPTKTINLGDTVAVPSGQFTTNLG